MLDARILSPGAIRSGRRRFPRIVFPLEIRFRVGADFVKQRLDNLSHDGFAMHCAVAPKQGQVLDVVISAFSGKLEVRCEAEVTHVQAREPNADGVGVGLRFVQLDPRTQAQLELVMTRVLGAIDGLRAGPRFAVNAPAFWRAAGSSTPESIHLANLGLGGALLEGANAKVGTRGLLSLGLSGAGEMIATPVTVVWAQHTAMSKQFGVKFDETPQTQQFVTRLLHEFLFAPNHGGDHASRAGGNVGGFQVGGLIARGQQLQTFRGRGQQSPFYGRDVALLRYQGSAEELSKWHARFQATGRVTRAVAHPGLVEVYAALRSSTEAWLALEMVEGWSLDRILIAFTRARVNPPLPALLSVVLATLDSLERCHHPPVLEGAWRAGVVHGDLRPSCVFVRFDGTVKLAGLGNPVRPDATGTVIATRRPYLSPEVAARAEPSIQSDVFQLGVVLYEAVCGLRPRIDSPAPPSRFNPEVTPELDAAILAALNVDPAKRPQGAVAFAKLLRDTRVLPTLQDGDALRATLLAAARAHHSATLNPLPPPSETVNERVPATAEVLPFEDHQRTATGEIPFADDLDLVSLGTEAPEITVGSNVGRYTILARLAAGGMGDVWLASTPVPSERTVRVVVLKTVKAPRGAAQDFVELFLNEVRIAAMLNHPSLVQMFDIGVDEGRPFLAMEYVAGRTLAEVRSEFVKRGELVPEPLAARIVAELCAGLYSVHTLTDAGGKHLRVVHRDVTPRNIQVAYSGEVKLLDFGIAKTVNTRDITNPGTVRGTIHYLSPEHVRGEKPAPSFDVWALGLNLYAMLVGKEPFGATGDVETMRAILYVDVPKPSEVRASVDPELERITMKALEKDTKNRYATAADMGAELEAWLRARPPETSLDLAQMMNGLFSTSDTRRAELEKAVVVENPFAGMDFIPESDDVLDSDERVTTVAPAPVVEAPRGSMVRWLAVVVGVVMIAGALVLMVNRKTPEPVVAPRPRAVGPVAPVVPVAPPVPELPAIVQGKVAVLCSVECAVKLDGVDVGTAPLMMRRDAGVVHVEATPVAPLVGASLELDVVVPAEDRARVKFEFSYGQVTVVVKPAGEVWVDGELAGKGGSVDLNLLEGNHEVRVVNAKLKRTKTVSVAVKRDVKSRVQVDLRKR